MTISNERASSHATYSQPRSYNKRGEARPRVEFALAPNHTDRAGSREVTARRDHRL
jgi:hypothetical protein